MRALFDHLGFGEDDDKQLLIEAPAETGWRAVEVVRLYSWRWGEQWMPHATWLLYAIVLDV